MKTRNRKTAGNDIVFDLHPEGMTNLIEGIFMQAREDHDIPRYRQDVETFARSDWFYTLAPMNATTEDFLASMTRKVEVI